MCISIYQFTRSIHPFPLHVVYSNPPFSNIHTLSLFSMRLLPSNSNLPQPMITYPSIHSSNQPHSFLPIQPSPTITFLSFTNLFFHPFIHPVQHSVTFSSIRSITNSSITSTHSSFSSKSI